MRAISIEGTGPPNVIRIREVEALMAGPGEPFVRCVASGGNSLRTKERVSRKSAEIFEGVEAGWLVPPRVTTIPMDEAGRMHESFEDRGSAGERMLNLAAE